MLGLPLILGVSGPVEAKEPVPDPTHVEDTRGTVAKEVGQVTAEADFLGIPEVTNEGAELAKKSLKTAYSKIEKEILPKLKIEAEKPGATYEVKNGYAMVKDLIAKGFHENDYLPLMIKESRLNANAKGGNGNGFFQIEPIIQDEVKKYYKYEATNILDPVQNCVIGILTIHRMRNHYGENPAFKDLSAGDKDLLAYAMYNKGFQTFKTLFEISGAKTYPELEKQISDELLAQLEPRTAKKSAGTVTDEIYNVPYLEYQGVDLYLKNPNDPRLNAQFKLNGKETWLTLKQAGIVLRYPRLIKGIKDELTSEQAAPAVPTNVPSSKKPETTGYLEYEVKPGDTLWKFSRDYGLSPAYIKKINGLSGDTLTVGTKLKMPALGAYEIAGKYFYKDLERPWVTVVAGKGFYSNLVANEKYNAYLTKEITLNKSDIEDVIIDFNIRFNPELKGLKVDASNIPLGAQIWIPNTSYFIDYFKGVVDVPSLKSKPEPKPVLKKPDDLPDVPSLVGEIPSALDKVTSGQYAKKVGGVWVRDVDAMRKGAERFADKKWKDHPTWDDDFKKEIIRKIGGETLELKEMKYIILHSTQSESSGDTVRNHKAHFVIERDGTIRYLVPIDKDTDADKKVAPHAGRSAWGGTYDLNQYAIGIEVVAKEGQDWSPEEFAAAKKLIEFIGGYYGIQKNDVLLHKMVAYSQYGRGRKSDPNDEPSVSYSKLGLPDNSKEIDLEVAKGEISSNSVRIESRVENHTYGAWDGLDAGLSLQGKSVAVSLPKMDKATLEKWKAEIKEKAEIVKYTVQRGDSLYEIAKKYSTTVEIIQAYNSLSGSTISVGQNLEVPKSK